MRILSPKESDGLLKAISDTMSAALADQRKRILDEFSLDNKNGALNRLVEKLTEKHGEVSNALQGRIDVAVGEFSLDKRDSALSRLVRKVTKAQRTISSEFSLDNEKSALSRMSQHLRTASETIDNHLTLDKETSALFRIKRELQEILAKHAESAEKFQSEVIRALDEMKVRRDEWQRAPIHGKHFQQVVHGFVQGDCKLAGEVVTFVGDSVGAIKNCKVGDTVLELGEDHVAAGACIVIEAKDKDGFTLQKARWEIEQARTNREAGVGVFVFARATAPEGLEPFQRLGDDIFVVWDPEDLQSDIYLRAALMVARALCSRRAKQRESNAADLSAIDKAINEVEKKIGSLEDIQKHAETIRSGAEKILERTRVVRESIERQVSTLRESIGDLKKALAEDIRAVSAGARAN